MKIENITLKFRHIILHFVCRQAHFVCRQAKFYGVTPIVTFDQLLYWKYLIIKASEPVGSCIKSVVLRLGGFHLQMSFLGSIGHLMAGSGLQELLETVYAGNSVKHMLSGKITSNQGASVGVFSVEHSPCGKRL